MAQESKDRQLELAGPMVTITSLNNRSCNLEALIDTGSPVSFIDPNIFVNFFDIFACEITEPIHKFKALGNVPISISGIINARLTINKLPGREIDVPLHIISERASETDLILGRDFLSCADLTLVYHPIDSTTNENIDLFPQQLMQIDVYSVTNNMKETLQQMTIDFGDQVKKQFIEMIIDVENSTMETIDDDYCVRVNLKDSSTYAYAPRKFAILERLQIRTITDDLLERNIIKPSVSPYCARVVPIRKKNGKLRLCVDLRPLNSRVLKQTYPFPLIEDASPGWLINQYLLC